MFLNFEALLQKSDRLLPGVEFEKVLYRNRRKTEACQKFSSIDTGSIWSYLLAFCDFAFMCFLDGCRWQQVRDALVQLEQEGHAFGVGGVGFFAAAGLVGGVYGGV